MDKSRVNLVSILIPCYNAELYIAQAIESALDQVGIEKEVIVIDDGSTDNSWQVIQTFGDKIQAHSKENKGGNATRNELLKLANGDWIQYLDADDYLLPEKIINQLKYSTDFADAIYSPTMILESTARGENFYELPVRFQQNTFLSLLAWDLPQTNCFLFKKSILIKAGGWNENQKVCQDHRLYFDLLINGATFLFVNMSGSVYRIHSNNSLCRKDPETTRKTRWGIMKEVWNYCIENDLLSKEEYKIAAGIFVLQIRDMYQVNRFLAKNWSKEVYSLFGTAKYSPYVSKTYTSLFNLFGLNVAESIAKLGRRWK